MAVVRLQLESGGLLLLEDGVNHLLLENSDASAPTHVVGSGRPYTGKLKPYHYTKKDWKELQDLIAAEEAAAKLAREQPKKAEALAPALQVAEHLIDAIEESPLEPDFAGISGFTAALKVALAATSITETIKTAQTAAILGREAFNRLMDEDDVELLLLS